MLHSKEFQEENAEKSPSNHNTECVVQTLVKEIHRRNPENKQFIVRVSGFGSLGKSTLSQRLAAELPH